jgi:predicted aconitase
MRLTDKEKTILDGDEGRAKRKAMELLVRYGEALGAERLVHTNNVCGGVPGGLPNVRDFAKEAGSIDAVFSEINLDAGEILDIPQVEAMSCRLIQGMDPAYWELQGVSRENYELNMQIEKFCARIGLNLMNTCAPYQVGNIPVKGEHCAWMESSAVIYCNSVLGARTNTEGSASRGAAMLVGKTPHWGYHLDENRKGTHLVEVEYDVESVMDWSLLGYYVGEIVQEKIPVLEGIKRVPNLSKLKQMGAAAASSGGLEMVHIVGITPEARSLEEAFGKDKPIETLKFSATERKEAYENVTSAKDSKMDFVMLGCPHYSLEQVWQASRLLEGKKIHPDVHLWIFTAQAIKAVADRMGYTKIIQSAGGYLMTDTCPAIGGVKPEGARVAAVDSCKQAHYMQPNLGLETWFGTLEDCIDAAITGKWRGEIP